MADAAIAPNQPGGRRQRGPLNSALTGYLLAGPALLAMIAIFVYPLGYSFVMSFFHRPQQLQGDSHKPALPTIAAQPARFHSRDDRGRDYGGRGRRRAYQRQVARPSRRAHPAAHSADDRARCRRPQLSLALQFPIRLHRRTARRSPSARDPLALGSKLGPCLDHHRGRLAEYAANGAAFPRGPAIIAAGAAGSRGCGWRFDLADFLEHYAAVDAAGHRGCAHAPGHRHVPHLRRRLADDAGRPWRRHQPRHRSRLSPGVPGCRFRACRRSVLHRARHIARAAGRPLRSSVAEGDMMAAMSDETADAASVALLPTQWRPFPIGLAARYAVLLGTILLTIFPLVWLVITSLRIPADIFAVPVHVIPASITWRQYVNVFTQYNLAGYLWNTVIVSLVTVVLVTVLAVPCAYAMARFRLPFHRVIVSLLLIMRMIPVVALAIPLFAVFANLGLLDTLTSLVLAHTAAKLPVAIWLLIGFVQDVPKEIEESAAMDGAGTLRTLVQIVTPLIAPGLGASAVITFLFTWNDLLIALTLASSENAQTLPVGLTNFVSQYGVDWGAMSAAGVLMVIPTLIFVWFAQGLLVKGLVTGAVRG